MHEGVVYDRRKAWFLWGMVLVGTSSILFLGMFFNAFRGMAQDKATGLAAVAGGLTEAYVTFGLILTFVLPIASVVLLGRSLSGANRMRKLFSLLFIVWSSFIFLLYGLCAWFFFVQMPRLVTGHR
jgi:hypothetical protein